MFPRGVTERVRAASALPICLQVRLDEPQPLVHPARDLGEHVGGVLVLELIRLVDARARQLPEGGQRRRHRLAWSRPALTAGYSGRVERVATWRAVPCAVPPSCTRRSARSST
jgi:hypothetical protein